MMHAQGATTVSSTQGIGPLCGRSKVVAIRPAATTHAFIKPCEFCIFLILLPCKLFFFEFS